MSAHLLLRSVWAATTLVAAVAGQSWFLDARKSPMPLSMGETESLLAAPMNGDGLIDLLAGNALRLAGNEERGSHVLLNRGAGRFEDVTGPGPAQVFFLAAGDMDRDGDRDVVYRGGLFVQDGIALNDGNGALSFTPLFAIHGTRAVVGDVDRNGWLDVLTGHALYLNQGALVFQDVTATHLPPHAFSAQPSLAIADVDRDSDLDLVIGDRSGGQNLLWLNDGTGHFSDVTAARMPVDGEQTQGVAIADMDNDGDDDLVFANYDASPALYLNDGAATFTASGALAALPARNLSVAVGDVDRDGWLDLALGHPDGGTLVLARGGGAFAVAPAGSWSPGARAATSLVLVDLDGDTDLDLVQGSSEEPLSTSPFTDAFGLENSVFFNDGRGHFLGTGEPALPASFEEPWTTAGDVDGDGDLDVLYTAGAGELWANDGQGRFAVTALGLAASGRPTLGDLDGDGDLDLLLLESQVLHVLRNAGNGAFTALASYPMPALPPDVVARAAAPVDYDNDGDLDVFVATGGYSPYGFRVSGPDVLWDNDGAAGLSLNATTLPSVSTDSSDVVVGDVDGDRAPDVVVDGGSVYLNRVSTAGTFVAAPLQILQRFGDCRLALGDLDGDGDLDVVAGNDCQGLGCRPSGAGGPNAVHWNDGTGSFTGALLPHTADTITTGVVLGDVDADGDLDIVFGNLGVTGIGHDNLPENLLLLNKGNQVFEYSGTALPEAFPRDQDDTSGLWLGDVDADGDADLLVFNRAVDPGASPRTKIHVSTLRHLWAPWLARLGRSYPLQVYGAERGATVLAALGPARVPVPPFGIWGLDPATTGLIAHLGPPATGRCVELVLVLPPVPALAGLTLWFQALVYGPTLAESRLTNRLAETLAVH